MRGQIFNIQKFCLHDGPGIRTTVFFKGCNLRCKWCANPESQNMGVELTLDRAKCTGCGLCVRTCLASARSIKDGISAVDTALCSGCGNCASVCPVEAIGCEGRGATVEEVLAEVMKDQAFYAHSGGGVTFSGGEVLMQQEFASALARKLHERGVHVAAETAAAVPNNCFRAFLQEVDYVLFDLKHHDSELHRQGTGIDNAYIIENLRTLQASGLDYLVRIPVIPGYNDSINDAVGFADLLAGMNIRRVQLLPFHQLGERKYALLGRDYVYAGVGQLHREDMKEYQDVFESRGIHVQL